MCYWICHSLRLLNYEIEETQKSHIAKFLDKFVPCYLRTIECRYTNLEDDVNFIMSVLDRCQSSQGGFGGGPGQQAHMASTYAAVNALCCLNTEESLQIINRYFVRPNTT